MITIKMNEGESEMKMVGDTMCLIAEGLCVIKAMYNSFGKMENKDDAEYGKKVQKFFKEQVEEEFERIFSDDDIDENEDKKEDAKNDICKKLDELENELIELLKEMQKK